MRLTLHIFYKDARRCWKEIALTLTLLAWLTRMDSWRSADLPDASEGWLNLLLPLAWAWLAGVCVLQDPVPGERQFWLTLPCGRRAIAAAKALFMLAFIHLPYLLSNAKVLMARGFAPWHFLPRLAQQQILVLLVVTLPAVALSTLARTATQFLALAFALLGAVIVFSSATETIGLPLYTSAPWLPVDRPRELLALGTIAILAVFLTWFQFRFRRTRFAGGVGIAGLLGAAALYVSLPAETSAALGSALLRGRLQRLSVTLARPDQPYEPRGSNGNSVTVAIPLGLHGAPALNDSRFNQVALEIVALDGGRFRAIRLPTRNPKPALAAFVSPRWEVLLVDRALFARLNGVLVTLHGTFTVDYHLPASPVTLPKDVRVDVAGVGKCTQSKAEGGFLREDGVRVSCEWPGSPEEGKARLLDRETGRDWIHTLGTSGNFVSYPRNTWLSPVDRSESYFQLAGPQNQPPVYGQWQVPKEVLAHSLMEVIPNPVVSHAIATFELPGIRLSDYVVRPKAGH